MSFGQPEGQLTDDSGAATVPFRAWISWVHAIVTADQQSGTTAKRPTDRMYVGRPYFDTTLGKPIWVQSINPTVWCDATGAAV